MLLLNAVLFHIAMVFPAGVTIPPEAKPIVDLINTFVNWGVALGASLCALTLVGAGINYQTAGGNPQKREGAKDGMKGSIIGLTVCLFAWTLTKMITGAITPGTPISTSIQHATAVVQHAVQFLG